MKSLKLTQGLKKVLNYLLSFLTLFAISFNCIAKELSDLDLKLLAQDGNVSASYNLGVRLLKKNDRERAFGYFLQSAEGRLPIGQYQTAQMYRKGDGTDRDHTKALNLYREAYAGGIDKASFYMLVIQSDPSSQEYDPVNASILIETMKPDLTEGKKSQIFKIAEQLRTSNKSLAQGILTKLSDTGYEPAVLALSEQKDEEQGSKWPIEGKSGGINELNKNLDRNPKDVAQSEVSNSNRRETRPIKKSEISKSRLLNTRDLSSGAASEIQRRLKDLAYYEGTLDGEWGPNSESSLREFGKDISQEFALDLNETELLRIISESIFTSKFQCSRGVDTIESNTAFSCFQVTI